MNIFKEVERERIAGWKQEHAAFRIYKKDLREGMAIGVFWGSPSGLLEGVATKYVGEWCICKQSKDGTTYIKLRNGSQIYRNE